MPLFEYKCLTCNHKFEKFLVKSKKEQQCPECKGIATKQFSLFATKHSSDSIRTGGTHRNKER